MCDTVAYGDKISTPKSGSTEGQAAKPTMSAEHKQAWPLGAKRAVPCVDTSKLSRRTSPSGAASGRPRESPSRLRQIDSRLPNADALTRVHLVQERLNLQTELESRDTNVDLKSLEDGFVGAAKGYGERKGLTYAAWRAAGVDPTVLRKAGIPRTKRLSGRGSTGRGDQGAQQDRPSLEPRSGSMARSGCGISPTTLPGAVTDPGYVVDRAVRVGEVAEHDTIFRAKFGQGAGRHRCSCLQNG